MIQARSRAQMAERLAQDIPDGSYVNLGIGLPEQVANFLPADREIVLHSENGILGMGPAPAEEDADLELINAGKKAVTLLTGGAFFNHVDSFTMMRGGHLDISVMGGMQVSAQGDLANWSLGKPGEPPAVGGAMDLAVGAHKVYILMEHNTKDGSPKILERCTLPLTGLKSVDRIYTDLAVIEVTPEGLKVIDMVEGLTFEELQKRTGATLTDARA